jgi:CelD/BcsL family acetyltransferase involved in cellulose biosynthesis
VIDRSWIAVESVSDRAAFGALEGEWNALVSSTHNQPFFRHEFIRIWLDNFEPGSALRTLLGRDVEGQLVAALPLVARRGSVFGLPLRELASAANPHSCRFDLIAREPVNAGRAFFEYLAADTSWDVLRLIDIPAGGDAWQIIDAAAEARFPVGAWESQRSPFVPLPQSPEALEQTLTAKFRSNLRRRRKRLEEKGSVCFERLTGGLELEGKLEEGLRLERQGWKGIRGTAVLQDRRTRGFYSELARTAAYQGSLSLFFLRLDGRAIAFQYGLNFNDRYFLLKPAYDESLAECSPGQLLMEHVLRDCISRGLRELDFLGPDMTWKRDWAKNARTHHWLFAFRPTLLGGALKAAKFDWLPMAKRVIDQWKR